MVDQIHTRMTAAEFKQLPESNTLMELINGELIVSPSPKAEHQQTSRRTVRLLEKIGAQGILYYAPFDVYLDEENVVQPDILWMSHDNPAKLIDGYLHGVPDLIIEILSPGTSKRDRREKFELYQKHGVREYWLIDTVDEFGEVYRLENGQFARHGIYEPKEVFRSTVLSHDVNVSEIFEG